MTLFEYYSSSRLYSTVVEILLYFVCNLRHRPHTPTTSSKTIHTYGNKAPKYYRRLFTPCMDSHFPTLPSLRSPPIIHHPSPLGVVAKTAGKKGVFINGTAPFLLVRHNRETWRRWRCVLGMYFVHAFVLLARSDQSNSYVPRYSADRKSVV